MTRKNASDIAAKVAALVDEIEPAAKAEIRELLAQRLQHMTTPRGQQDLLDCKGDSDFVPTPDFLAGLAFAAELVADPNFDY